jgi:carboxylesterase type B
MLRFFHQGTPAIYVNFNYRVGPLGFPQGDEAAHRGGLNLGLKDQLGALEWIQANIGAFGGDKSKVSHFSFALEIHVLAHITQVTVFGESAGAISTAIFLLSPSFERLARAVVSIGSPCSETHLVYKIRFSDYRIRVRGIRAFVSRTPRPGQLASLC